MISPEFLCLYQCSWPRVYVCLAPLSFIPLHLVRLVHWLTLWFDLFATQCFNEFRARLLPIEYTFEPNRGMHFVGIKSHAKPVPTCSSYMIHFFLPNMLNTHSIYLRLKFLTTMFFCAPVNVTFHLTSSISANNALFLGIPLKLALLTLFLCLSLYLSFRFLVLICLSFSYSHSFGPLIHKSLFHT